jgi:putative adenylate-forming enzyme
MLGDLTVGLSSGTSGNRGVFLASKVERLRWAGIILARALSQELLGKLLMPWRPRLRIAFFLRANSNLYTTLNNRRVAFSFYDLLKGVNNALERLNEQLPDILVGPPALLCALAEEVRTGRLRIQPRQVISVADVLEDHDADLILKAFGVVPGQLYQATEGFLGYSCESDGLHLNECFVHVEQEWLDAGRRRFQPIITDFSRDTQLIVRYRLNDVLKVSADSCPCGRAELSLDAIEGRADEVLWLPSSLSGQAVAIFPDQVRRAMILAGHVVHEYDVVQSKMHLQIGLLSDGDKTLATQRVSDELEKLWDSMGVTKPIIGFSDWQPLAAGAKRRRIRVEQLPDGLRCTF